MFCYVTYLMRFVLINHEIHETKPFICNQVFDSVTLIAQFNIIIRN